MNEDNSLFIFFYHVVLLMCLLAGICAMCGKKVLDTKNYKQTSV